MGILHRVVGGGYFLGFTIGSKKKYIYIIQQDIDHIILEKYE